MSWSNGPNGELMVTVDATAMDNDIVFVTPDTATADAIADAVWDSRIDTVVAGTLGGYVFADPPPPPTLADRLQGFSSMELAAELLRRKANEPG